METGKTMSVPEAGRRYFDIGKNASYEAVKRGEIPVIKIGSRLRVPVSALDRMLEEAGALKTTPAR
jgi:excisionase family DNA binding protein